jgi:hypothetical protein
MSSINIHIQSSDENGNVVEIHELQPSTSVSHSTTDVNTSNERVNEDAQNPQDSQQDSSGKGQESGDPGQKQATAMVTRRGSVIILGDTLREAAEAVNKKAMMARARRHGEDFKAHIGLATVNLGSTHSVSGSATSSAVDISGGIVTASTPEGNRVTVKLTEDPFALPFEVKEAMRLNANAAMGKFRAGSASLLERSQSILNATNMRISDEEFLRGYMDDHIIKLDASRIMLPQRKVEIVKEKHRLRDLKQKEQIGTRILDLEREISEKLLETQKVALERKAHEIEYDAVRKHVDAVGFKSSEFESYFSASKTNLLVMNCNIGQQSFGRGTQPANQDSQFERSQRGGTRKSLYNITRFKTAYSTKWIHFL